MENHQLVLFDYQALDTETRDIVQREDRAFDRNMGDAGANFLRACENLTRIHEALHYTHPGFVEYCNTKTGLSVGTAWKMLNVAKMFSSVENISITSFTALYLLADPSTPDPAREEARERAQAGEPLTYGEARKIVDAHKALAAAALDTDEPPSIALNAAQEVIEEYQATGGYVTTYDGEQVPATTDNLIDAAQAAISERQARQTQHIQDGRKNGALFTSDSYEWYTPPHIIEYTRHLLGEIDLDPCTCDEANLIVGATYWFTQAEDGLSQAWHMPDGTPSKVYMNPPYGETIGAWVDKLYKDYMAGNVAEAVLLLPARTDTQWIQILAPFIRCFIQGRLRFANSENSAPFPSVIVYLGQRPNEFAKIFAPLGNIYVQWRNDGDVSL